MAARAKAYDPERRREANRRAGRAANRRFVQEQRLDRLDRATERRSYVRTCNEIRAGDAVIDALWDAGLKDHARSNTALDTLLAGRLSQRQRHAVAALIESVADGVWAQAERVYGGE